MSYTGLSALAGTVLSLAFSYIPGLKDWYAKLSGEYKRLVMLAAIALTAVFVFGAGCLGYGGFGVACDKAGAWQLLEVFFAVAVTNQAAYKLTPPRE